MITFQEARAEQKARAKKIRMAKSVRKPHKRAENPDMYMEPWPLYQLRTEFRHWHIALCELRGRTRDEIENPAWDNMPSEHMIKKYKEQVLPKPTDIEESDTDAPAVCASA